MTKINCKAIKCKYNKDNTCTSDTIEIFHGALGLEWIDTECITKET